ncbi:MAG: hypothetical protein ACRD22_21300, partial [Terriglobia bacterium]
ALREYKWNENDQLIYVPEKKVVAEVKEDRKKRVWIATATTKIDGKSKKIEYVSREGAVEAIDIAFGRKIQS